ADPLADLERHEEVLPQPVPRNGEVQVVALLVRVEEAGARGGAPGQLREGPEPILLAGRVGGCLALASLCLPGLRVGRWPASQHGAAGRAREGERDDQSRTDHGATPVAGLAEVVLS